MEYEGESEIGSESPGKRPGSESPGKRLESSESPGKRPRLKPRPATFGVTAKALDELQPQLMYGALYSILKASTSSICFLGPVIRSRKQVLLVVTAVIVAYVLLFRFAPLATLAAHAGTLLLLVLIEGCFFVRMCRVHRRLNQVRPIVDRRPAPTGALDLFRRTLEVVDACATWKDCHAVGRDATEWLEMWFLGNPIASIRRGNFMELMAWAFFTREQGELDDSDRKLLEHFVAECERRYAWHFKEGYNPAVKCIRINFDPLNVWCHPLAYYAGIWGLSASARQYLRFIGFTYHPKELPGVPFFYHGPPYKPGKLIAHGQELPGADRCPVVFIHGLGPGLSSYLRFIRRLASSHECFVIELPEISQAGVENVLPPKSLADTLATMLSAYGHESACFVSHSYGTVELAWVLRHRPDIVSKAVFLDPVCFLLSQPDVCFNVLYRQPGNWFTMLAANTVFWELYTANTLKRNFIWYDNVLWLDELPKEVVVSLSSLDDISNAAAVRCYLEEFQRSSEGSHVDLKMLWFDGFFHGEMMLTKSAQLQVMELL